MRGTGFDELRPTTFRHMKGHLMVHGTEKNHQTQRGFIESDRRMEKKGGGGGGLWKTFFVLGS
ncbi:hypothetical protein DSLASN_19180 [Desulfoluna limicola]|uniref:Uncharacterized protein n=1 Tax=Desulfoluna limicola TaxID=2810562 RepID=A0ABN6F3U1_9BACT|nr:hypothetical protein DSLASN_19180 [Desulfoluna limicola]